MALIPCPECRHDLSTSAAACPSCGYQNKREPSLATRRTAVLMFIAYVVAAGVLMVILPSAWTPLIAIVMLIGAVIEWRRGLVRKLWTS